jgi:phenylalanyl-tRNA synthetase beta chain
MKTPLSWLKDYVDINIPVEDLAERLTLAGLEVENIQYIGLAPQRKASTHASAKTEAAPQAGLAWDRDKIVVAAVLEVKPHPNADRLVLAEVDYGDMQPHTVVTGAPNLFEYKGQGRLTKPLKVIFAKTGAVLYDGHQPGQVLTTLKPTKIRGVPSDAMVCSEKELGISDEHEGILFLPDDAPVGQPLADYMGDVVLTFDIKGGFGHLQNVTGIAREAAALLGVPMNHDVLTILDRAPVKVIEQTDFIELEIADPDLCPRYSAALIRGVKIGPSPFWMQQRLLRAGMRPINNIVDITNYVMLELGQPLHAFDYHKLSPRQARGERPAIIVRRAHPGEAMTTLDGQLRQLDPDMLLITDGGGPVAIAGVMGGLESEVADRTTDILLEGANFNFLNNRRTSQMLGLKSEASMRFGKQIDPELTLKALARAGQLMEQLAGGRVEPVYGDLYPGKRESVVITLDPVYVNRLLGLEIPIDEMVRILTSLEFNVTLDAPRSTLHVVVPSHRLDVRLPADLAEEIARVHGYDRFPSTLLRDELPPQRDNPSLAGEDRVRDILIGCGLDEIITYSLTTEAREALLLPPGAPEIARDNQPYLRVINPIAADRVALRHTLLASALDTVAANLRFGERAALFEIGVVYLPRPSEMLPDEVRRLSIAMTGLRQDESWHTANPSTASQEKTANSRARLDFWDIKGVIEMLVGRLRLNDVRYEPADHPTYHTGRATHLMVGEREIGMFGELHPLVRQAFDLPQQPVCVAEFDLVTLLDAARQAHTYQAVSRFPAVHEDIAVVVDEAVTAAQVEATIWEGGGDLLRDVRLFDLYHGEQVGAGRKSLAYRLAYQADDRTLTDDDAAKIRAQIVKALEHELSATLRA